jgi:uncharacterized alkaline shock family protein YloU
VNLEVRDPAVVAVAGRTADAVAGVARLHEPPWPSTLGRARTRSVEVERSAAGVVVTVRLVVRRGRAVIDVVRTVQRSVRDELLRLTGLATEVVVVVVDLD